MRYGLLRAFKGVFIIQSMMSKMMVFRYYVMWNCKIDSRYDSNIL